MQKGFFIIVMVVLIVIMALVATTTAYLFTTGSRSSTNRLLSTQAYYLAEAGLERGTFALLTPHVTSAVALTQRYTCTLTSFSDQSLGAGVFTVTPTAFDLSTTLNGALTSSATTITVTSTAGFATRGRVRIDREAVDYYGTTATTLTGVVRGRDGTTAVAHATATPVAQYQCSLVSEGEVPTSASPVGRRVLEQAVQQQKAWMVGNNSSGDFFGMWDGVTWIRQGPDATIPNVNFNDVTMLSYADGWGVGNNGNFAFYNGASWNFSATLGTTVNGVYCVSKNDCWAVGNSMKFYRYTGTTWSESQDLGATAIHTVFCVSSTDCWAAGASAKFYRYTGTTWSEVEDLGASDINNIFCLSSTNCLGVGASFKFYSNTTGTDTGWSEVQDLGGSALNGLYCYSSTDCWAVGNSRTFARYNGTTWSDFSGSVTSLPNVTYSEVACYHPNDCWAVGNSNGGEATMVHWDGSAWTRLTVTALPNVDLNAIDIVGARDRPQAAWEEDFY